MDYLPRRSDRNISPVKSVTSTLKKNIFSHHQVIIDGYYPAVTDEVFTYSNIIAHRKVSSVPKISALLNIEILAGSVEQLLA